MISTPARETASTAILYSAFALTGFATALLGATLPVMLARWSLSDGRAGTLFLLLFLGSSSGALLSRGRAAHSVARGAALLAPACVALAFASGRAVFPLCFVYGLGLGITITSINLLRSERCGEARVTEMNRLNLLWGFGAFACPWLANEILRVRSVRFLFLGLGGVFAVFLIWTLLVEIGILATERGGARGVRGTVARLPVVLALMTLLATGLESSTGAWIATYADRLRRGFEAPVAGASVFWFGLLASRLLHSTEAVGRFSERTLLRAGVSVAAVGCCFLLASRGPGMLLVAAFLIGFGVGPVYPLLLAAVLPRVAGNTIFLMAGLGGAVFPWLTGAVSSRAGSLGVGMAVPAMVGFGMLGVVGFAIRRLEGIEGPG